jgi:hypothetical protein
MRLPDPLARATNGARLPAVPPVTVSPTNKKGSHLAYTNQARGGNQPSNSVALHRRDRTE